MHSLVQALGGFLPRQAGCVGVSVKEDQRYSMEVWGYSNVLRIHWAE